jgi:hypothetical protein
MVILYSGNPRVDEFDGDRASSICGSLSDIERVAASNRASTIAKEIQVHIAHGDTPKAIIAGDVDP